MHPKSTPNTVCQRCGKPFYINPAKLATRKYCSRACYGTSVMVPCQHCGRLFNASGYRVAHDQARFCSRACMFADPEAVFCTTPLADRFWSKVDRAGGAMSCWNWTASTNGNGYGQFSAHRRMILAPRMAWILTNGDIPDGLHVCHRCDNPLCCNPAHLFLGTNRDNVADKVAKGRQLFGEAMPAAHLTEAQARAILIRHGAGETARALAAEFHVSQWCVFDLIKGRTWKHLRTELLLDRGP